jgi:amino acid adenylation domain-containing protein
MSAGRRRCGGLALSRPALQSGDPFAAGVSGRLDSLFAEQARRTPERVAVLHEGVSLRYGDLDAQSDQLAFRLRRLGAGPGTLVGVCMRRTPRMVTALLAVLKAGAAYVPLDPAYPTERLDYMLADSAAAILLADSDVSRRLAYDGAIVDLRVAEATIVRKARTPLRCNVPEDLAYVIYTSGSTGRPKGVMLGHSAVSLIEWAGAIFSGGELSRVAATTSICFDPSVFEIFAPICLGGTVILKRNALKPFTPVERPTLLNCVPTILTELCRLNAIPDSVRVINVGGEPLKASLVREVYRRSRVEAVYNHYGPTEATTCAAVARVPRDVETDPPIGRPVAGAELFVLNAQGRATAPGECGEICIGGPGLALGYLNRPDLTAERFIGSKWGRIYRTGDLGRWSVSGELEFAGRLDQQVKIRGLRVELGEIEAALVGLAGVENAAVVAQSDVNGRDRLVAYLQATPRPTLAQVRAALTSWLPDQMLPDQLVTLDALPLTLSGKVDRSALAAKRIAPAALAGQEPQAVLPASTVNTCPVTFRPASPIR